MKFGDSVTEELNKKRVLDNPKTLIVGVIAISFSSLAISVVFGMPFNKNISTLIFLIAQIGTIFYAYKAEFIKIELFSVIIYSYSTYYFARYLFYNSDP